MNVKRFIFNPLSVNTYVVSSPECDCAIIDCGCMDTPEWSQLYNYIESEGLNVVHLLNTHMHLDHVFGNKFILDQYGLKPECTQEEYSLYKMLPVQISMFFSEHYASRRNWDYCQQTGPSLHDGDIVKIGSCRLEVLSTPGHSPGGISFYSREDGLLFSGDTIFNSSVGRTDLWGGSMPSLISSIKDRIFTLPDSTLILPGHGESTTVENEKSYNPFVY